MAETLATMLLPASIADSAYWVHDLSPFLIRISGNIGIRYYGLAYVLGFLLAWLFLRYAHARGRSPLDSSRVENLALYLIMGVVLGGRIGYMLLYRINEVLADPLFLIRVWEGGMASHGGFIGVFIAVLLFSRRNQVSALTVGDLVCTAAPPGLLLGRLANFVNGELWGKITDFRWAVIFPEAQQSPYFDRNAFVYYSSELGQAVNPRHPSQLYEAALEGVLLGLYMQLRFWLSSRRRPPGQLAGEFFIVYAMVRVIGELFREPDADLIAGLSRGIFYSLLTAIFGVGLLVISLRKNRGQAQGNATSE